MPHTNAAFTQNKPNTDAQIFINANGRATTAGVTDAAIGLTGLAGKLIPASTANAQIFLQIENLLTRTGMYQTNNPLTALGQQAFGTANGPGPSTVAGTSGPSGYGPNNSVPPITKANLPTIAGSVSGPVKKGVQINTFDLLYQVLGGGVTSMTCGLTLFNPASPGLDVAVTPTVLLNATAVDLTVNSANTKIHRVRLTPTVIQMLTSDASIVSATIQATTPAGVTIGVAGIILNCSFNFN